LLPEVADLMPPASTSGAHWRNDDRIDHEVFLMATDLKNVLRQEAAQCRRLAELVTEQTIRQALMEMAVRLEALAHEDRNDEQ
jgi:hypothetical protein